MLTLTNTTPTIQCRQLVAEICFKKRDQWTSEPLVHAQTSWFVTPVLQSPVEAIDVTVEVWADSDAPDTDFMAKPLMPT